MGNPQPCASRRIWGLTQRSWHVLATTAVVACTLLSYGATFWFKAETVAAVAIVAAVAVAGFLLLLSIICANLFAALIFTSE